MLMLSGLPKLIWNLIIPADLLVYIYRVSRKKCYLLIFLVNICHEAMYYTFLESLGIELQNKVDLKNVDPHKDDL